MKMYNKAVVGLSPQRLQRQEIPEVLYGLQFNTITFMQCMYDSDKLFAEMSQGVGATKSMNTSQLS